ncbi:2,3-diaminopropionate biosynthesis protein SbnA [Thioflavicoccus mobilis]|nr:2,3-diaminopropionate biosynthesis protein SbnA [Thioflavicoccus mobilis]
MVGDTPLLKLNGTRETSHFSMYAKLESCNPTGSAKDRPALGMVFDAIRSKAISKHTIIVESTSGNMGIALAHVCARFDLRFHAVVDWRTPDIALELLEAYGAEIDVVQRYECRENDHVRARIRRVQELLRSEPCAYWPNQYGNPWNPKSHYIGTMPEITRSLGAAPDYLFVPVSTCGTIMGCATWLRDHGCHTRVIAVDVIGSGIFAPSVGTRSIPGMGASGPPELLNSAFVDDFVRVTDNECVISCRELLDNEGLLMGGSSGAVMAAIHKHRAKIASGSRCVLIFPDAGDRYLKTIFDDEWAAGFLRRP